MTRLRLNITMAEDFVMLADLLAREIKKLRSADAGLARQPVSLAVGQEREIAGLEHARLSAFDLEPGASRSHEVKHHAVVQRRQRKSPWCGELGYTCENLL
jgi:hypothetical protein